MKSRYLILSISIFVLLTSGIVTRLSAQTTGEVRGFVYDKETGEPIIFTNVFIKELKIGKQTDVNGFYAITRMKPGTYVIQCYFMGYDTAKAEVKIVEGEITNRNLFITKRTNELHEVEVSAEKQKSRNETKVSVVTITQKDMKKLPSFGGEPDLAQFLQVLPGVVFSGDQGGQLYIRGGPPVQNKIILDGMTIYNPFHSIGLFSVFDADIIRTADVYAGGFNSQYGGRVGSIVDVSTKEGNKTKFSGKLTANPIYSKILLEGPLSKFNDGSSVSYILSYKNSYLDQTSKLLYPYAGSNGLPFSFSDLYGKLSIVGNNGSKINLFGFNFRDAVNYTATQYGWNSSGVGANFLIVPSGSTIINGTLAYSNYNMSQTESDNNARTSGISGFNIGLNFTSFIGKDDIKYGIEMNAFNTAFNFVNAFNYSMSQDQSNTELCAYIKYKKVAGRFLFEPGIRIQDYASLGEFKFEPRVSAKYLISDIFRVKASAGYYTQNLMSTTSNQDVVNLFYGFLSGPESTIKNDKLNISGNSKLSQSYQYVGGVEADIGLHGSLNIEGFYKYYIQLPELNPDKLYATDPDFIVENGKAFGGDILYKYEYKRIYIWAVYSLTYVTRNNGILEYLPNFDRRHNVNLVGNYSFGKDESWSLNARWNFASGFPFTPTQGFYQQFSFNSGASSNAISQNGQLGVQYADLNSGRLPYFHRLDISLSKKIKFSKNSTLLVVASCTNVYDRPNVFYFDRINYQRINQLPIIPTLGINFNF